MGTQLLEAELKLHSTSNSVSCSNEISKMTISL